MTLEDIERLVIEKTLQRTSGNKQAAANLLGFTARASTARYGSTTLTFRRSSPRKS